MKASFSRGVVGPSFVSDFFRKFLVWKYFYETLIPGKRCVLPGKVLVSIRRKLVGVSLSASASICGVLKLFFLGES